VSGICGIAARQIRKFSGQNPEVLHPKNTHGLPNHDLPNASSVQLEVQLHFAAREALKSERSATENTDFINYLEHKQPLYLHLLSK